MRISLILLAAIALTLAASPPTEVIPSDTPSSDELVLHGCQPGNAHWHLAGSYLDPPTGPSINEETDRGDWTDYNGDGYLCWRYAPGFEKGDKKGEGAPAEGTRIWKDNDVLLR